SSSFYSRLWILMNPMSSLLLYCREKKADENMHFVFYVFVFQVASRKSRQAFEAESVEGVWSDWGEWSECSQTCGVGVSQRSRKCLAPPIPQTPPFSHPPPNWAGYSPGGGGGPAFSPVNPYFPPRYPGQHPSYRSPSALMITSGLPVSSFPFWTRRSSSIRPGQFGYGKVPFSLPLHRTNRQARHAANGTDDALRGDPEKDEETKAEEEEREEENGEQKISEAEEEPITTSTTTTSPPHHVKRPPHTEHRRNRLPSQHSLQRSSSPPAFVNRHRFDWNSVTAPPPPPVPPLSRSRSPNGSPLFSSPLHRPSLVHGDRELHSNFNPQPPPGGNMCGTEVSSFVSFCVLGHQVCGGGAVDSRAGQCAAFNTQEFMGRLYNWEPFTEVGADKQCELTCRPAGYRFYVRLAERVRDGTPCFNVSTNDVCVEGRCLTEGCDGVLGSSAAIDKCGVCGGRDTSCQKVAGSFQNVTVPLGYHKILDIPAGATFINVTERRASPNYLAIRSGTGVSVVNGRWAVDPPGEYQAGGTTFTYTRPRAQSEGEDERGESLRARGPTTTQLQLYIIFHKENPGIDYEFYIPVEKKRKEAEERETPREAQRQRQREPARAALRGETQRPSGRTRPRGLAPNRNARIPPRTDLPPDTQSPFVWRRGGLADCSVSCGKGSQQRIMVCVNRHTDEEVSERSCDSAARPAPEEEPCNTQPCPPFWEASAWSECSVSCGPGVQQRQLQCRQSFGSRSTMVHPQRCSHLTQPESTQACQLQLCSHWEVSSSWSTCSVDCGVGRRTRSVRCVSDQGSVVNENECNSRLRPQGSEECNMGPCVTNWYFTEWSNTCSAQCGPGVQKREVVCLTRGGARDGGGGGDCIAEKPLEMKACNRGPCVPTVMWYSSPWSQCSVLCGDGSQRRDNICVKKMGSDFTVVPATECAHLEKPAAVQECDMGECEPQWFTTEWSACSRSCGKGLQVREVRCLTPDKQHSQACDPASKPEQEQICNTIPCGLQVTDKNCRDRRDNCLMVVQARMCVYSYYKTACCASSAISRQPWIQSVQVKTAEPPERSNL
uniref:ADAMTS like 4 n=1 Tax=Nothobranchius furzeri TaxID=105023 RepID=A0A8C6PH73_NOTFU